MSFGEYVDGRTIAIVGPAPVPYDQTAEIDAHDIVYRTTYGHVKGADRYVRGLFPTGTGTRVDMAFYNAGDTHRAQDGFLDDVYADLDWAIHKIKPPYVSPITNIRAANKPKAIHGKKVQPNQVPIMLWDLTFYSPAKVTVFGSDFYLGPIETWYDANYQNPEWIKGSQERPDPTEAMGPAFHDQELNRQIVRAVRDTVPWLAGDDRFLKALDVPREVHEAAMLQQSLRYKSPQTV